MSSVSQELVHVMPHADPPSPSTEEDSSDDEVDITSPESRIKYIRPLSATEVNELHVVMNRVVPFINRYPARFAPDELQWGHARASDIPSPRRPFLSAVNTSGALCFDNRPVTFNIVGRVMSSHFEERGSPRHSAKLYVDPLRQADLAAAQDLLIAHSNDHNEAPFYNFTVFTNPRPLKGGTGPEYVQFDDIFHAPRITCSHISQMERIPFARLQKNDIVSVDFGVVRRMTCHYHWRVSFHMYRIIQLVTA
ncbi:hypothetical protein PsYK624_080200 [Phanerochaete sordida]|uniref:Uncharacterized protein n=1 Tax=Phanerochaete sordida TaxID=48140 RepID=A0A9P3LER4_9APHY|nr:hypothetical protein PsYK624_080200 [Phanerochaete sordida]